MNGDSKARQRGCSALRILVLAGLVATAALTLAGCSGKHIDLRANTDEQSRFGPGDDWKTNNESGEPSPTLRRPRAPFLSLSSYDWEYAAWLQRLADLTRSLELPESAEAFVTLSFTPGQDDPEPAVQITCEQPEAECRRLTEQLEALTGYPPLPEDFPHPQLDVIISRVPR